MRIMLIHFISVLLLAACNGNQKKDEHSAHTDGNGEQAETYTCPMHPQVVRHQPGVCPICGMALVKINKSGDAGNSVMLNDTQLKLGNITTQRAGKRRVGETVIINGTLTIDEEKTEVVSSRAEGRIEKLFIKETGRTVQKGEPLYTLYSETLLTLQQEYLLAKEQFELLGSTENRYKSFLEAAERKLLLYGLTERQIANLKSQTALQPRITFVSPASGIVTEISAAEGQYLTEGGTIYRLEDINSLWVEAELYPNETSLVKTGDRITVRISGFEAVPIEARVTFLSPEYRANSQIVIMRAEIRNPDLQFKPGQRVQVFLTHSSREAIAIPVDAVIRDESGTHVYVQSGLNTFQPRMVKTGLEGFDFVEITDGLEDGDTVAVTGAYLLYSEIILKKGSDPMSGHTH
jgi:membrane fusion protein, copper/silver efflux system